MEYASRGVANAGLTTGIIGTALGVLNGGLGLMGNGFEDNHHVCSDDRHVNRYELKQSQEIAAKDSEIALLKANNFTDTKLADIFERLSGRINGLEKEVYQNTCTQAVTNQKLTDNITFVDSKFDGVYKDIEVARREGKSYVDNQLCKYVPGKLVMPLDSICPAAMPLCPEKTK